MDDAYREVQETPTQSMEENQRVGGFPPPPATTPQTNTTTPPANPESNNTLPNDPLPEDWGPPSEQTSATPPPPPPQPRPPTAAEVAEQRSFSFKLWYSPRSRYGWSERGVPRYDLQTFSKKQVKAIKELIQYKPGTKTITWAAQQIRLDEKYGIHVVMKYTDVPQGELPPPTAYESAQKGMTIAEYHGKRDARDVPIYICPYMRSFHMNEILNIIDACSEGKSLGVSAYPYVDEDGLHVVKLNFAERKIYSGDGYDPNTPYEHPEGFFTPPSEYEEKEDGGTKARSQQPAAQPVQPSVPTQEQLDDIPF